MFWKLLDVGKMEKCEKRFCRRNESQKVVNGSGPAGNRLPCGRDGQGTSELERHSPLRCFQFSQWFPSVSANVGEQACLYRVLSAGGVSGYTHTEEKHGDELALRRLGVKPGLGFGAKGGSQNQATWGHLWHPQKQMERCRLPLMTQIGLPWSCVHIKAQSGARFG